MRRLPLSLRIFAMVAIALGTASAIAVWRAHRRLEAIQTLNSPFMMRIQSAGNTPACIRHAIGPEWARSLEPVTRIEAPYHGIRSGEALDEIFQMLTRLRGFKVLNLSHLHITDAQIAKLAQFPDLEELSLRETPIDDAGVEHLLGMKNLRTLCLFGTKITTKGVERLAAISNLEFLDLRDTRIDDAALPHLQRLVNLELLYLGSTQITDDGLVHLNSLPSLKLLDIGYTDISDRGLEILKNSSIENLYLDGTLITDAGLAHLSQLKRLHYLQFNDRAFHDIGHDLKRRFERPRRITQEGVDRLKKASPDLIVHTPFQMPWVKLHTETRETD